MTNILKEFKVNGELVSSNNSNLPSVPRHLYGLRMQHGIPCPECGSDTGTLSGWENDVCHQMTKCGQCGFEFHYAEKRTAHKPFEVGLVQQNIELKAHREMISGYLAYKKAEQIEYVEEESVEVDFEKIED